EAARDLAVVDVEIETPIATTTGKQIAKPRPLVVPILRAGLGMLDGMVRMAPTAEVGFLGMIRDDETLNIVTYATRLPKDLTLCHVFLLDQLLVTVGTLSEACRFLYERNARRVSAICLLAAPEGINYLEEHLADLDMTLYLAAIDERLDENAYIVPGPRDAGDRLH